MTSNERRIKNSIKRIIKKFPQYKVVDNIDNADLMVIYDINDGERFNMVVLDSNNKEKIRNSETEELKIFYLKHKNPRDRRQLVTGNINKNHFVLQN